MELWQKIESYMQRKVDFNSEVILKAGTDYVAYIDIWNITEKPKPTQEQLSKIIEPFVPALTLDELKIQDNKNCKTRLEQGVLINSVLYDMNTEAKSNILGIMSNLTDKDTIDYIDYDYNPVRLTKAQLTEVLQAIIQKTAEIYNKNARNQTSECLTEQDIDYSNI